MKIMKNHQTFCSTATFLTFHRNSSTATISAKRHPKPKTTNTPPTASAMNLRTKKIKKFHLLCWCHYRHVQKQQLPIPNSAASSEPPDSGFLHIPINESWGKFGENKLNYFLELYMSFTRVRICSRKYNQMYLLSGCYACDVFSKIWFLVDFLFLSY